jgi:hypothetical protein
MRRNTASDALDIYSTLLQRQYFTAKALASGRKSYSVPPTMTLSNSGERKDALGRFTTSLNTLDVLKLAVASLLLSSSHKQQQKKRRSLPTSSLTMVE